MTHEESKPERFLGMTKFQFMGAIMVVMSILFIGTVYNLAFAVRENKQRIDDIQGNSKKLAVLATRAAEDHVGLCAFIADLDERVDANRKLLREQTGKTIIIAGLEIDRAAIESQVASQGATLNSLRAVHCTLIQ